MKLLLLSSLGVLGDRNSNPFEEVGETLKEDLSGESDRSEWSIRGDSCAIV